MAFLPIRLFPADEKNRRFVGHKQRAVTISIVFFALLNDRLSRSLVIPILPFLIGRADSTGITIGLLVTGYSITSMIVNPFAGELCDRFGRRPVLLVSLALAFSGMTLFGVAGALPLMFVGRLIDGVGGASASISATIISDVTPPRRKTEAFGLLSTAAAIAIILGPGLGGALASQAPRLPIYIASLALFLNALFALLFLPETISSRLVPKLRGSLTDNPVSGSAPSAEVASFWQSFIQSLGIFKNSRVFLSSVGFTLISIAGYGLLAVISLYMSKTLSWGAHQAGIAFSIAGLATVIQQFTVVGPLSRRFSSSQMLIIAHIQALVGLSILLFPLSSNRAVEVVFSITMITLALGLIAPVIRSLVAESSGARMSGSTMGVIQSMQNLGSCFGPIIVGVVYSSASPQGAFQFSTLFTIVGLVFIILATRPPCGSHA